ncbi:MAG: 2'-deoxycytidine 5'-triphosphate deaminase [Acidimicrobiia bacterium]|nr:2'-deoxycytidine 5'-triphosphate deaminase [Acidimicrobiia bacterium]
MQPASLDLRLGQVAHRLRCSFLPGADTVESKLKHVSQATFDLEGEGAVLEKNVPYLVPLVERLDLPKGVRARTNPKTRRGASTCSPG